MNKVFLIGRLTKDPAVNTTGNNAKYARYTLAVNRKTKEKETDFISCITFGKSAEFVEKYLKQGSKIAIEGRIQTGSYTDREGRKVYTTDVVVEAHEFAESGTKSQNSGNGFSSAETGMPFDD